MPPNQKHNNGKAVRLLLPSVAGNDNNGNQPDQHIGAHVCEIKNDQTLAHVGSWVVDPKENGCDGLEISITTFGKPSTITILSDFVD